PPRGLALAMSRLLTKNQYFCERKAHPSFEGRCAGRAFRMPFFSNRVDRHTRREASVWRREGLKVPPKQPKRGRLWRADGSCIRLRPESPNHVWSYDFIEDRTHDG